MIVTLITSADKRDWNKNLLNKVHGWAKENNFLKGEKFALSGEFIPASGKVWKDLVLKESIVDVIQKSVNVVEGEGKKSRGLLFIGPPGTGKTLTGKILMDNSKCTFIWISAKDMYRIGTIGALKMAFELARDLSPTILFIEDIDSSMRDGIGVDLLKTEMDGVRENKGLVTILTSNNPEKLPDALLDRPGRFHEIINFVLPTKEIRENMLNEWVDGIGNELMEEIIEKTEGFSGAHMKELVEYAKIVAEDDKIEMPEAIIKSLNKLIEQRELVQSIRQDSKDTAIVDIELKEGKVISKKNRKVLSEARDALTKVLEIEEKEKVEDEEDVKGISEFTPEKKVTIPKKVVSPRAVVTQAEVLTKTLQSIAKVANQGLRERKSVRR